MEVLVGGLVPRIVGKLYTGITDNKGVMHKDQPFLVLREVTFEEWEAFTISEGVVITSKIRQLATSGKAYFYGISTD